MDDAGESDDAFLRLKAAGWSIGVAAFAFDVWIVSGANGENLIRVNAATQADAWREALDQARAVGMLDGIRPGDPGAG